jgi:hypothetical protein
MGRPRQEHDTNLRNDGPGRSQCDDADESWFLARFGLFPSDNSLNYMPCMRRDAIR